MNFKVQQHQLFLLKDRLSLMKALIVLNAARNVPPQEIFKLY